MTTTVKRANEATIAPTACIHPTAELDAGVEIGPFCVIGPEVNIGKGTSIGAHTVVEKWTTIGSACRISQFVSIGAAPQDVGYKGEKTEVIIGDGNIVREFVTVHRATTKEMRKTVIGSGNLLMNYVHVAHDCVLGDNIIMANSATLAGHVSIDSNAIVGGLVAIHQHVRIGAFCIIGGASAVSKDIPPYVMAVGNRAKLYRLNSVGLRRQGFTKQDLDEIKTAYNIIFRSSLRLSDALKKLKQELPNSAHAKRFSDFIGGSKRGIARLKTRRTVEGHEED
ncbi:MAG: acyl-ACP--UDP-N-acetylglucosamine O-acyltransferase [Deltaproteobacteria bacterium]|nr:acyl-ACP--UDP-N-acetylglucosamine O-acyltransferase [Deltaproteobacteria bacterium]